jgi:hypothetical protein
MYNDEIYDICHKIFGDRFIGVFARDQLTKKYVDKCKNDGYLMIVNNNTIKSGGEHWISIYGKYMYDSFGRKIQNMNAKFKNMFKGFINSKNNVEQELLQTNCGQRCITWLLLCDIYGAEAVVKVI